MFGNRLLAVALLVLGTFAAGGLFAQLNDTGFNPNASWNVKAAAMQPDGKIVIGGDFTNVGGVARNRIARLNADGNLDASFNPGSGVLGTLLAIAVQPNGKILIGGFFTTVNGVSRNYIARLNANGSLDTGFDPGSGTDDTVRSIAVQPGGKIVIGGLFTSVDGVGRNRIARLNADGSLDTGFDPGTGANNIVYAVALQTDGKIVIGGTFTSVDGVSRNRIARLNTDGSFDTGFDPGVGTTGTVFATALQADGKIVIGGAFTSVDSVSRNRVARLNADGSLDAGFDPGSGAAASVYSMTLQADGKIVIGGNFTSVGGVGRNYVARLNIDGSLDAGFDPGAGASSALNVVVAQVDGKTVITGVFTSVDGVGRNYIARLNADGSLENGFDPGTGADNIVYTTTVQADGRIVIGGTFTSVNGVGRVRIARLNADGGLDTSFDPGTGADNTVFSTTVQPDGKIVISGDFTSVNGVGRNRIARLNADGSLDTGFDPGAGVNDIVYAMALQADGKIMIGGFFTSVGGVGRNRVARLNADGSLDTGFDPGTGASATVNSVTVQPDGKIIIGGTFQTVRGASLRRIARFNADGSLDTSFNPGSGASMTVYTTPLQPDGKIVIGGLFLSVDGVSRSRIARLNPNGSLDTSFDPGSGASELVASLTVQADGKILMSGTFVTVNGVSRNRIARLNADGSVDTGFDPGTGANNIVYSMSVQPDGKIVVGGLFTSVNGTARNRIARLSNTGAALQRIDYAGNNLTWTPGGTMPMPSRVEFQTSPDGVSYTPAGAAIWSGSAWELTSVALAAGWTWVRAVGTVTSGISNGSGYPISFVRAFFIGGANAAPVVGLTATPLAYVEDDPPTALDATATVTDADSADFDTGSLSVTYTAGATGNDMLQVLSLGGLTVTLAGSTYEIDDGSNVFGTYPDVGAGSGVGTSALIVSFNGFSTPGLAQAVLRAIAYSNGSQDPSGATRTVEVTVDDGDGGSSNQPTLDINLTPVNDAPTLTTVSTLTGGTEDTQFVIAFATLETAADEADVDSAGLQFRIEAISTGTLTINSGAVTPGTTIFSAGQLEWMPATDANGVLPAFTIVAWDGSLASTPAIQVSVDVAAVNDAPTLTTVTTLTGATVDTQFVILFATLTAAADEADVDLTGLSFRIEAISSGTLTINSGVVTPGTTIFASGDQLEWTPDPGLSGILSAFTIVAWDGALASTPAVQVLVNVAPPGGSGDDGDDDKGCLARADNAGWMALLAVLTLFGLLTRLRRARTLRRDEITYTS